MMRNDLSLFQNQENNLLDLMNLNHNGNCLAICCPRAGGKDIETDTSKNREDSVKMNTKLLSALNLMFVSAWSERGFERNQNL